VRSVLLVIFHVMFYCDESEFDWLILPADSMRSSAFWRIDRQYLMSFMPCSCLSMLSSRPIFPSSTSETIVSSCLRASSKDCFFFCCDMVIPSLSVLGVGLVVLFW